MRFGSLVAGVLLVLAASCSIPIGGGEVGDVRVTWSFADGGQATQRCAQVGVDNVTVQLIEKGKEGGKAFGQTAECIAGSMVIPDVLAGTYTLTATGEGEVAVFDNQDGVTVEVKSNAETAVDAPLSLVNGEVVSRIEFQYTFAGEATCSAANVDAINAQVIDADGVAIAGSNTPCIAGLATVEGVRVGEHTLRVEAIDGDGNVRFLKLLPLSGLQAGKTLRPDPIDLDAALADLLVHFAFEGKDSCADAGVANVDLQLRNGARVIAGQNVNCVEGQATFLALPLDINGDEAIDASDVYTLRLDGIDGGGEVLFSKTQESVLGPDLSELSVTLDAVASTVLVRFTFEGGLSCAELSQPNIDIQIVDSAGNATGTNVPCIAGDSGPLIAASGDASIFVDAIVDDDVVFHGQATTVLEAGNNFEVIALVAERSTLEISWDFALVAPPAATTTSNSCIEADVDTVIVRVFRGSVLEVAQAVDCDDGRVEIPGVAVGDVRVELEGIREQEGDAPFFIDGVVNVQGNRTPAPFTLDPALVFVLIVWAGDCGAAGAATVDVRIDAAGLSSGVNLPCAQGSQKIVLPRGAERSQISINLRGVDGQGVPDQGAGIERIGPVNVVPGTNTFRFAGPT